MTTTKIPVARGLHSDAYEFFDDGFDPNDGSPFGPDKDTMFLPVIDIPRPTVSPVLERVSLVKTMGDDGVSYHGEYIDPNWEQTWAIEDQYIEVSREIKVAALEADRDTFVANGYSVGPFAFPLTEHFFRLLADRLRWLGDAVAAMRVPSNTKLTFSDLVDREVSVGLDTLQDHFVEFGVEYLGMYETLVAARNEIQLAATPADVDAVTWTF